MIEDIVNYGYYKATDRATSGDIYSDLSSKVKDMSSSLLSNKRFDEYSDNIEAIEHKQLEALTDSNDYSKDFVEESKSINKNLDDYNKNIKSYSDNQIKNLGYNFDDVHSHLDDGITIAEIDNTAFDNLITRMRASTFRVDMVNAYSDIVEPLLIGQIRLHDEHMTVLRKHQWENTAYTIQTLETLQKIRQSEEDIGSSLILSMRQFVRQPVWYTLGQASIALLKFTGSTIWSVLFGRDKSLTVQEKILEATRQQTEFLRTGQISQQRGFFERLLNQGIAGMPLRALGRSLLSEIGIDKQIAQQREEQKSRGEDPALGLYGKLSDMIFGDEITKKGRPGGILGGKQEAMNVVLDSVSDQLSPIKVTDSETVQYLEQMHVPLQMLTKTTSNIYDNDVIVGRVMEKMHVGANQQLDIARRGFELDNIIHGELVENKSHVADSYEVLEDVKKNTRLAVKEQKALRRQLFIQNMLKLLSSVAGNILQFGNMVVNSLKGLGMVIGGVMAARMAKFIPSIAKAVAGVGSMATGALAAGKGMFTTVKDKVAGKGASKVAGKAVMKSAIKKIPILGALAGVGFGLQRLMSGDVTGAGMEVASGVASIFPGFGTAASVGIDATLAARDMNRAEQEQNGSVQVLNENLPDEMQGNFANFEQQALTLPSDAEVLERIHATLGDLTAVMKKQNEQSSSNQFPLGHDDLTYQNVYGAN